MKTSKRLQGAGAFSTKFLLVVALLFPSCSGVSLLAPQVAYAATKYTVITTTATKVYKKASTKKGAYKNYAAGTKLSLYTYNSKYYKLKVKAKIKGRTKTVWAYVLKSKTDKLVTSKAVANSNQIAKTNKTIKAYSKPCTTTANKSSKALKSYVKGATLTSVKTYSGKWYKCVVGSKTAYIAKSAVSLAAKPSSLAPSPGQPGAGPVVVPATSTTLKQTVYEGMVKTPQAAMDAGCLYQYEWPGLIERRTKAEACFTYWNQVRLAAGKPAIRWSETLYQKALPYVSNGRKYNKIGTHLSLPNWSRFDSQIHDSIGSDAPSAAPWTIDPKNVIDGFLDESSEPVGSLDRGHYEHIMGINNNDTIGCVVSVSRQSDGATTGYYVITGSDAPYVVDYTTGQVWESKDGLPYNNESLAKMGKTVADVRKSPATLVQREATKEYLYEKTLVAGSYNPILDIYGDTIGRKLSLGETWNSPAEPDFRVNATTLATNHNDHIIHYGSPESSLPGKMLGYTFTGQTTIFSFATPRVLPYRELEGQKAAVLGFVSATDHRVYKTEQP